MISYEKIKKWWDDAENRQKVVLGICYVVVFVIGFGSGRYNRGENRASVKQQVNYTTKTQTLPTVAGAVTEPKEPGKTMSTPSVSPTDCVIKGNINSKGQKIFHIPGGASYKIVKPEQCFKTAEEAVAAGFIKASR